MVSNAICSDHRIGAVIASELKVASMSSPDSLLPHSLTISCCRTCLTWKCWNSGFLGLISSNYWSSLSSVGQKVKCSLPVFAVSPTFLGCFGYTLAPWCWHGSNSGTFLFGRYCWNSLDSQIEYLWLVFSRRRRWAQCHTDSISNQTRWSPCYLFSLPSYEDPFCLWSLNLLKNRFCMKMKSFLVIVCQFCPRWSFSSNSASPHFVDLKFWGSIFHIIAVNLLRANTFVYLNMKILGRIAAIEIPDNSVLFGNSGCVSAFTLFCCWNIADWPSRLLILFHFGFLLSCWTFYLDGGNIIV